MAINFPDNPVINDIYTVGSKTWKYDGEKWVIIKDYTLNSLDDVVINTPEEFQTLEYDGTNWVNSYSSTVTYVRNAEATTLTTGTAVYLFGATGDHASVKRADNDSDTTSSKTIGLVGANILASENGPVITRGYVDGIDLSTGYAAGDVLWLGEDGAFTKTKPSAPEHLVFIGVVVRATVNGIIYVATQNGYELDELHDVSIVDKQSGDFLKYNGSLWVNDPINLGTDTVGNYMSDVSAGTGITVTHTPGEGSTATVAANIGTTSTTLASGDRGLPAGGAAGQILAKASSTNYDDTWREPYIKNSSYNVFNPTASYILNGSGHIMYGLDYSASSTPALAGVLNSYSFTIRCNHTTAGMRCMFNRRPNLGLWISYVGFGPRIVFYDSTPTGRDSDYLGGTFSTTAGMQWYRFRIETTGSDTFVAVETAPDSATEPVSWTTHASKTMVGHTGINLNSSATSQIGSWYDSQSFGGTISRVIERHDGVVVLDADFSTQQTGAFSFTESSANAHTVTVPNGRFTYSTLGDKILSSASFTYTSANQVAYTPITVTEPTSIDAVFVECTGTPAASRNVRFALYSSDSNLFPTGAPLFDTGDIAIASIGPYIKNLSSPVTVQPGVYLVAFNRNGTIALRAHRTPSLGQYAVGSANHGISYLSASQTYGAFPSTPTAWDTAVTAATGFSNFCRFRYRPA